MGGNTNRTMAIVRAGGRTTAMTEGSREFCNVLETISAAGTVIPPFIVWKGKSHRQSYYYSSDSMRMKATFAVSESGYMDDDLGLQYIKEHFDLYTQPALAVGDVKIKIEKGEENNEPVAPRWLIVDGHSSHVIWRVVQYALDHNIHMICLPSKSTHILQPLDVGCFGLLQTTYEKNLSAWLRLNPLLVISKAAFQEIQQQTRTQVYSIELIQKAWKKSRCWPIDRDFTSSISDTNAGASATARSAVQSNTSTSMDIGALDTPGKLRALSKQAEDIIRRLPADPDDKDSIFELIDLAMEKVTKYRDIMPRADTLSKLRSGKVRRDRKPRSKRLGGEARVLTYDHVNQGLKKLEDEEKDCIKRLLAVAEKKKKIQERRTALETLLIQWKPDIELYDEVIMPGWSMECTAIDSAWAIAKQHGAKGRKPKYPLRLKRPRKPKESEIQAVVIVEIPSTIAEEIEEDDLEVETEFDNESEVEVDYEAEELVNAINALLL